MKSVLQKACRIQKVCHHLLQANANWSWDAGGWWEQGGDPVAKVICSLKGAKLGTAAAELFYLNQSISIESFGLLILRNATCPCISVENREVRLYWLTGLRPDES